MWHSQYCWTLVFLFCCTFITSGNGTPTTISSINSNATENNYNCPEDCHCLIPAAHHDRGSVHHFLHAECKSLKGLKSDSPVETTLPIHSIDLSNLNLPRLSHALEKLHDLTSIDLSHNELHEFGHLGRRIKRLNLKHNRITSNKLSKLPQNIQYLNLQHNDISYLPLEFTKLSQLQTLELSHNPINCSCETLEVRNWLQERHVFMETAVKCSLPFEVKGKPWLQVRQVDICAKEKSHGMNWELDENENELMLGDQPAIEGSGDLDDEEELGKDFMPVEDKSQTAGAAGDIHIPSDVEGSGDLSEMSMPLGASTAEPSEDEFTTPENDEDDDGSGSGAGILLISPHLSMKEEEEDLDSVTYTSIHNHDDSMNDNKPLEDPTQEGTPLPINFHKMGIYDDSEGAEPVQEETIVPVVHHENAAPAEPIDKAVLTDGPSTEGPEKEAAIMQAKVGDDDDSNATYFLLGVIVLIVVGLILFVGIKRCKNQRNARHDAENPRQTELLDMDKKNLGKPLHKEHAPLIGDKSKADMAKPINGTGKKPYNDSDVKDGGAQDQPLLKNGNSNGTAPKDANEPNIQATEATAPLQQAPHEYYPITPRYPTPKSPRASKYAQYPQGENNNNSPNANDAYLPSSPKSGRYSPVYSPETGRVKIKLTETPKPKTPMLVTRSKSNAGDIITTPVNSSAGVNGTPAVAIHTAATNGHATGHY